MKEKHRDLISSVILIVFSLLGLYLTLEIPEPFREYDLGAAFLPRLVLVLIGTLSVLKIVVVLLENQATVTEKKDRDQLLRGLCTIVLVGLYCFCYKPVGFLLDTFIYLFVQIMILTPKEKKSVWKILFLDIIATAAIYLIFSRGFSVRLPQGLITFI